MATTETRTLSPSQTGILRKWLGFGLAFFLLASLLGSTMRWAWVQELSFLNYKNVLHAHSHIAMMGWAYTVLTGLLLSHLVPHVDIKKRYFPLLLLNVVASLGMAVAFVYQGYGAISISFSTLHIVAAYLFGYRFLRDLRQSPAGLARFLARWSVYWMLFSTLGLWAIAPVSATLGRLHPLYFASIQFFTHFQFNGWFTFATLALIAVFWQRQGRTLHLSANVKFILLVSVFLTYALSITWSNPETFLFYTNSLGVLLQMAAFALLFKKITYQSDSVLKSSAPDNLGGWLIKAGILCLLLKVAVQTAVAVPSIAEISYTIHNFVIGFIHLIMLGFVSLTALGLMVKEGLLASNVRTKSGLILLGLAFLFTEVLLFGQGLLLWLEWGFMPHYYLILLICTLLFPISLVFILYSFAKRKLSNNHQQTET